MQDSNSSTSARGGPVLAQLLTNPGLGVRRFPVTAGAAVYEPDHEARWIYWVHQGQVRIYRSIGDGPGRLLEALGPNDWCGEAALARAPTYAERAVAVEPTVVSELHADRLISLVSQRPPAAAELARQLARKVVSAREEAADMILQDIPYRLVQTLLRLSRSAVAHTHPDGVVLHMTQKQLAQAIGAARETVSLALTHFRKEKIVRTARNRLMFDPDALRTHARKTLAGSADQLIAKE